MTKNKSRIGLKRNLLTCFMAGAFCLSAGLMSGCNWMGFLADVTAGGKDKPTPVAKYNGLEGKSVAVIVSADEMLLRSYPQAPVTVSQATTRAIKASVPSAKVTDPLQVNKFQIDNPYWNTFRNSQLIERLNVDRIVYVDLIEYATREPGNAAVWRGTVVANVQVIERDGANPENYVYTSTIKSVYPTNSKIGVVNSNDQTIQNGMLNSFSSSIQLRFQPKED